MSSTNIIRTCLFLFMSVTCLRFRLFVNAEEKHENLENVYAQPVDHQEEMLKINEIQLRLQEIFANEKPFIHTAEEEEDIKRTIYDVLAETELSGIGSEPSAVKRGVDFGSHRSLLDDATTDDAKKALGSNTQLTSGDNYGYLNDWVVHLEGGDELAKDIIEGLGYTYHGKVTGFKDTYRASHEAHPHIHKRAAPELTQKLKGHSKVVWAEQQEARMRVKRYSVPAQEDTVLLSAIYKNMKNSNLRILRDRNTVKGVDEKPKLRSSSGSSSLIDGLRVMLQSRGKMTDVFNDPLVGKQWYIHDTRTIKSLPQIDLRVAEAWSEGYTGAGVKVAVLDDGLDHTHPDLKPNYDPTISHDFNEDDEDPMPRVGPGVLNGHGTKCAGEIAMKADNGVCGVGVAYNSKIGGVRLLDGHVSDRIESESLSYGREKGVDIVVCSWGPNDDGVKMEKPGKLASSALEKGVSEGRGGKGIIFVWASGNGGLSDDNCNCDGYASSIYTIGISSASRDSDFPWYGESCASAMTSTYSTGAYSDQNIVSTDLDHTCTLSFTGTSAAAPLAAGVMALALEANKDLTWRDMQHLTVFSSNYDALSLYTGWTQNALGLFFNNRVGFGLLDAHNMVTQAKNWTNVPQKIICSFEFSKSQGTLRSQSSVSMSFDVKSCMQGNSEGVYLEHVEAVVSLEHSMRGALHIDLTSARGTLSTVLSPRSKDTTTTGFKDWPFMSVKTWGEDPRGTWVLNIKDTSESGNSGTVTSARLVLHAIPTVPKYASKQYKNQYSFHAKARVLLAEAESS